MSMLGRDEINRRLGFHRATADTIPMFEDTRARIIELACHWDEVLPDGREKALALTALQEAAMYANAAVACNLSPLEDPAGRQPNPLTQQVADQFRPARFRKKPVVIEATRWMGVPDSDIELWLGDAFDSWLPSQQKLGIRTLEGTITAGRGDWIIKGVAGEFYPCKPDIFEATYEPA